MADSFGIGQPIHKTSAAVTASMAAFMSSDVSISPLTSSTLPREVNGQPVHILGRFHDAFREGWMGMDHVGDG